MGIAGWVDAPTNNNHCECNTGLSSIQNAKDTKKTSTVDKGLYSCLESFDSLSNENGSEQPNNSIESIYTDSEANNEELSLVNTSNKLQEELLSVIAQLNLRSDESNSTYDISKIELHEVQFVFDHASRIEKLDFYTITRAIHKVKHRLLESELPPDSINCPNLDELVEYIENCYEVSINNVS